VYTYINIFYFLFLLHFLCAEPGYLFFWVMQWVNKIMYQEGNLLRYKDCDTTFCFGLIKQMEFHAVESCEGGHPGTWHQWAEWWEATEQKATNRFWQLTLYQHFSTAFSLHVQNPGFVPVRKGNVFTCEMLKLLSIRERCGWLPGKQLIHSLHTSLKKQLFNRGHWELQ
jgi:hypothetical protein